MLLPLVAEGKVYRSLKFVMTFKLIVVVGFLLFLAGFFSSWEYVARDTERLLQIPWNRADPNAGDEKIPRMANLFVWSGGTEIPCRFSTCR